MEDGDGGVDTMDGGPTALPAVVEPELGESADGDDGELILKLALARTRAGLLGISDGPVRVGRYEIADRVGSGAMGVVYSAHDDQLGRKVAIKILHGDVAKSRGGRSRLLREAQAMAKLSHPNVAHVYEVGYHDSTLFIAMEFIDGQTMRRWGEAEQSWRAVVDMHLRAGRGLAAAHKAGLIHRDYKPDNVLVGAEGRPRVLDFGLARPNTDPSSLLDAVDTSEQTLDPAIQSIDLTATGTLLGTPAYMAPEQLQGLEIDARADQYSFCVALFEALYGMRPFRAESLSELVDQVLSSEPIEVEDERDVPKGIRIALLKGLSRSREDRYASTDALLEALEQQRSRAGSSRRGGWAAVGLLAAGLTAGAGLLAYPWPAEDAVRTEVIAPQAQQTPTTPSSDSAWAAIVDATDLPPTLERPLPGDPTKTTVHRLRNGLTLYISPREHETVVHARVVIRADYRDERPGQEGLSGLVLETIQNGSARLGTSDFDREKPLLEEEARLIASVGRENDPDKRKALVEQVARAEEDANRFARRDLDNVMSKLGATRMGAWEGQRSMLLAGVPGNRVATFVELCSEIVQRPVFRKFLGAVTWTRDRSSEFAWSEPDVRAVDRAFAPNPDSRDPAIVADNLATLPLAQARAFYETYYRPNNVAIILVGDVTPGDVLPVVEAAFGDWEPAPIPATEPTPPADPEVIRVQGPSPAVTLAWRLPDAAKQWPALEALLWTLDGPDGVFSEWAGEEGIAYIYPGLEPNYFVVTAGLLGSGDEQTAARVEEVIQKALRRVAEHELSDKDWAAATAHREFSDTAWSVSGEALAFEIARSYVTKQSWGAFVRRFVPGGVGREEIEATARSLLAEPAVRVHVARGGDNPPPLERLPMAKEAAAEEDQLSAFAEGLLAQQPALPEPQFLVAGRNYEQRGFGSGNLVLVPRDGPRFEITLSFEGGVARDKWACLALMAKVNDALEDHALAGVYFQTLCGADETELIIAGLDTEFDRTWPLVRSWLSTDVLTETATRKTMTAMLSARTDLKGDAETLAASVRLNAVLRGRGATRQMPTDAELDAVDSAVLVSALERLRGATLDIGYVGPRPDEFAKLLPPVPIPAEPVEAAPRPPEPPLDTKRPARPLITAVDTPGSERMQVWFAIMPPESFTARDHLVGRLLVHGLPTPIAEDVEVRHWGRSAKAAMGIRAARPDLAMFGFVAPYDELRLVLDRGMTTVTHVPDESELATRRTAVEGMIRQDRLAPSWIPTTVGHWRHLGLTSDPLVEEWLSLPSITHQEIVTLAERLQQTAPLIAIAADRSRLDEATIAEFGDVLWIDASELVAEPAADDGVLLGYLPRGMYAY